MEIYRAEKLSFAYAGSDRKALKNLSFSIEQEDFILLAGASGSGKTTLLRSLKKELFPSGTKEGEIFYKNAPIEALPDARSASEIGYTAQNPDTQNVAEYVKNELAFLLQNLSYPDEEIALRVAQTVSFFGTESLYRREVSTLSGGEKQTVHLESVFVSEPEVLLLDEPLAQLDPFSAERFLEALRKIKEETAVTVVISSHNILPLLPLADKVLYMEAGEGTFFPSVDAFLEAHPKASLYSEILKKLEIEAEAQPKTIAQCRKAVSAHLESLEAVSPVSTECADKTPLLEFKNTSFRYQKNGEDILSELNFSLYGGEIFTIVGANGAGKSTLLRLASGQNKPYFGKVKLTKGKKVALVPQNPQAVFAFDSVLEILEAARQFPSLKTVYRNFQKENPAKDMSVSAETLQVVQNLGIEDTLYCNPFDLSGGQQQRVAIARALLQNPDVLLFDEATKGLEETRKQALLEILRQLKAQGKAILLVTHDLDFAAEASDRTALLFDGKLLGRDSVHAFFTKNAVYTSTVSKIFAAVPREIRPISIEEVHHAKT